MTDRTSIRTPSLIRACIGCKQPVLYSDRIDGEDGELYKHSFHADPIALAPLEEAACVILDRPTALVETDKHGRIHVTRDWPGWRAPPTTGRTQLGRSPRHLCRRPVGSTPLALPEPRTTEWLDPDAIPPF